MDLHASDLFNNFTRISSADFEFLISVIGLYCTKQTFNKHVGWIFWMFDERLTKCL
jgi:hypothetical protein